MLPAFDTFNTVDVGEQVWLPDSATASYMMPDEGNLLSKTSYAGSSLIKVGDGNLHPISNVGHLELRRPLRLTSILYVPQLHHNLLSVKQVCCGNNCSVIFSDSSIRFKDNTTGEVLSQASSLAMSTPFVSSLRLFLPMLM